MHLVASVHPSVRLCRSLSVCPSSHLRTAKNQEESLLVRSDCLGVCNQWACTDNCADVVDRLLIYRVSPAVADCLPGCHFSLAEHLHRLILCKSVLAPPAKQKCLKRRVLSLRLLKPLTNFKALHYCRKWWSQSSIKDGNLNPPPPPPQPLTHTSVSL